MIKTPTISPSFLLSLLFFLKQEKIVFQGDSSPTWESFFRECIKLKEYSEIAQQGFILNKWKPNKISEKPLEEWNDKKIIWTLYSPDLYFKLKNKMLQMPSRLILEWDECLEQELFSSLVFAKQYDCECWIHGPWVGVKNWERVWKKCNDLGISWAFKSLEVPESDWDNLLDLWMHPKWSIQRIYPFNEWLVRCLQIHKKQTPLKDNAPYPWKKDKHDKISEKHFKNVFDKWMDDIEFEKFLISVQKNFQV